MDDVRSIEWIQRSARAALDQLNKDGTPPRNPLMPGSEGHKEWAKQFYECSLAQAAAPATGTAVVHKGVREFVPA